MSKLHYITYATHDEGTYNKLINNKYNIKIKNIGFGHKWINFKQKFKNVYKYCNKLDNNDIVIFLDGFDSIINNNNSKIFELFKNYNCKILFSKEFDIFNIKRRVFNTNLKYIANTGLYMGYVKELKHFLKYLLKKKDTDDQILVNKYIHKFNYIKIDINEKIFKNINYYERYLKIKNDALLVQEPGQLNFNRIHRAYIEYFKYFIRDFLILNVIIIYYLNTKKIKKIPYLLVIFTIFIVFNTIRIF